MIIKKEFEQGYIVYNRPNLSNGLLLIEELGLSDVEHLKGKEMSILSKFIDKFKEYVIEVNFKGKNTFAEMNDDYTSLSIFQDLLKEICEAFNPPAEKKI